MSLVGKNLDDLESILRWNAAHDIELFRIGQSLVPFGSHPAFPYDWIDAHSKRLRECGTLARSFGIRLSMHPGQFVVPGSPDSEVRQRSLAELRYTARVLEETGASDGVIVLHVGGVYGDRESTRQRIAEVLSGEEQLLNYLVLENDERLWNVETTFSVASDLKVPVIVDTLHHCINPGSLELVEAISLAKESWEKSPHRKAGSRQKVHISSQAPERRRGAHADFVSTEDASLLFGAITTYDAIDVMVEAKASEKAALELLAQTVNY